jgi:hypothetical protein
MKKTKILFFAALAFSAVGLQSCLDFDTPSDEFQKNQFVVKPVTVKGQADEINYLKEISEEGFNQAYSDLENDGYFGQGVSAIYSMRGGKNGEMPGEHAYQRQFTLGPDNYAQFSMVPHSDFMYGTLSYCYSVSKEFNGGPVGQFTQMQNYITPALNNGELDSIPEVKALYLLMYDYSAIEAADLSGPVPYNDYKANSETSPFTYNDLRTIYYSVEENIDTIVNCLKHFDEEGARPDWYRSKIHEFFYSYLPLANWQYDESETMEQWWRFANSLKLRMAIHLTKVEPTTAKQWAEEAVASGVLESTDQEVGLFTFGVGFQHPLINIITWNDTKLSASFESLLMSLDHPYTHYLFSKNSDPIANVGHVAGSSAPSVTEADTRIVGMREGVTPGIGQQVGSNSYDALSAPSKTVLDATFPPLYLMKYSEVCFLRAEGALRGWNMGGTAQHFYEEGIRYAGLEDRNYSADYYDKYVDAYMQRENPVDYTYVDPTGNTPDMPSVTKIGVKWNDALDNETKLEMIITQKYIASYPYSFEAWVDMRRTGYPKLFPVLNPENGDGSLKAGDIIRRIPWASEDPSTISDLQESGIPNLGGEDVQATRLWWDTEDSNF